MGLIQGVTYNVKGLLLGLRTPKLLILGLVRFVTAVIVTLASVAVVLVYHGAIMELLWSRPESVWLVWLWHLLSWLLALILMALAAVVAYLLAQVLFCVFIMDLMSRVTERHATGGLKDSIDMSVFQQFFYLVRQEVPRTVIPVLAALMIMGVSWLTPAGPVMTVVSPLAAVVFLAWDHTDLVPARRLYPFKERFRLFYRNFFFHLGFGLLFLVPVLNLVFLSFAPVGATLYFTDKQDSAS